MFHLEYVINSGYAGSMESLDGYSIGSMESDRTLGRPDMGAHLVLSPMALLQRLSWLCVLPWAHTTHYHGVLAPAHPLRALIVPKKEERNPFSDPRLEAGVVVP